MTDTGATGEKIPIKLMGEFPSYRYKLMESRRRRRAARLRHGVRDPLMEINDKFLAYEFAKEHGVDHPLVYGVYQSISEVVWEEMPTSFVLKSRHGSSNRGVRALVRVDGGRYRDLLRGRTWTIEEINDHQEQLESDKLVSPTMFAEEIIWKAGGDGAIADDWKFYCFYGKVALTMQRDLMRSSDHDDWRFKFWTRDWEDMGPVKFADRYEPGLSAPRRGDDLVAMAEELSGLIKRPFLRIDLFEASRGPLLGEFTPAPGPPEVFDRETDEMLGAYWEEAEARIFAEEVEAGVWDHLRVSTT